MKLPKLNKTSKLENINSFMIAIIITSSFIAKILASWNLVEDGTVPIIIISALLVSYTAAIYYRELNIKRCYLLFAFILYILTALLISIMINGLNSLAVGYFIDFLAYGFIGGMLLFLPFDSLKVIYFTMMIGGLILINPTALTEFAIRGYFYERLGMGTTYSMLPSISAMLIYFFLFQYKRFTVLNVLSLVGNLYMLFLLLTKGNRGAILAIVLLVVFIIYIRFSQNIKGNMKKLLPLFYAVFAVILIYAFSMIDKIFFQIYYTLQNNGIEIAAMIKTLNMFERDGYIGLLNARDTLYERSLALIKESPFIGHGIGSYGDIYNSNYPHNLILQLLIEGGILYSLPYFILLIYIMWLLFKSWDVRCEYYNLKILMLYLFILCIPRLMVSSYYWRDQSFWLLLFISIYHLSLTKKIQRKNSKKVTL